MICGHVHQYRDITVGGSRHIWGPAASFIIGDPWQPTYGAKAVGYLEHRFHADGTHDHRFATVRDLVHNDLALMPEVYGDVTARAPETREGAVRLPKKSRISPRPKVVQAAPRARQA